MDEYGQHAPPPAERTGRVGPGLARQRTKKVAEMDRARVAEMMRKGYTFNQIAAELGVCRNTAMRDWKIILKRLRQEREINASSYVDLELAQIAQVKREAYEEWQRQKGDFVVKITQQVLDQVLAADLSGEQIKEIKIVYKSKVDPALLNVVLNTIKQECRLLNIGDDDNKNGDGNINLIWQQVIQSINSNNTNQPQQSDSPRVIPSTNHKVDAREPDGIIDVEKLIIEGIPKLGTKHETDK